MKPEPVIWVDGHKYRLMRPSGRPTKEPVFIKGEEHWVCPCCGQPKRPDDFYRDKNAANGLKSWCKACCNE